MKKPKILTMSEYSMGLVGAAEGSGLVKKIKNSGGGLIAAARGSKEAADLTKRKRSYRQGGAVKKK